MPEGTMLCDNCGKEGARERSVTRTYGKGKDMLIIEGVPVISCPHCGESYMTLETVRGLERFRRAGRKKATKREVAVVTFA